MARVHMAHMVGGSSTWRSVAGTKEEVAQLIRQAVEDGEWPVVEFEGRESVVLNPASVLWVADS